MEFDENPLYQMGKNIFTYVILDFSLNILLEGSNKWPLVGSQHHLLEEGIWDFLSPLHSPYYVII